MIEDRLPVPLFAATPAPNKALEFESVFSSTRKPLHITNPITSGLAAHTITLIQGEINKADYREVTRLNAG